MTSEQFCGIIRTPLVCVYILDRTKFKSFTILRLSFIRNIYRKFVAIFPKNQIVSNCWAITRIQDYFGIRFTGLSFVAKDSFFLFYQFCCFLQLWTFLIPIPCLIVGVNIHFKNKQIQNIHHELCCH